jgi:hypothetical protein
MLDLGKMSNFFQAFFFVEYKKYGGRGKTPMADTYQVLLLY